jgi:hypothetical protein
MPYAYTYVGKLAMTTGMRQASYSRCAQLDHAHRRRPRIVSTGGRKAQAEALSVRTTRPV